MPQENNGTKKTLNEIHNEYQYEEKPRRRWPAALAYLWAAFLVAVVIVFGVRWVYRTVNDSDNNKTAKNGSQTVQQSSGTEKQAENGAVIVPAQPGNQGSVTPPSKSSSNTSSSAPTPTEVPNTGDGAPSPDSLPNTGG